MQRPWFGVRRFGYGVAPVSAAGWAVMAVFMAICIGVGALAKAAVLPSAAAMGLTVGALLVLLLVVSRTNDGKPWRWRSGEDD